MFNSSLNYETATREISLGLMLGEIPKSISRKNFVDWFAKVTMASPVDEEYEKFGVEELSTIEVLELANECGLEIRS